MRVLVAARDVRVRRSLSSLLELDGDRVVGATGVPRLLAQLATDLGPDLVVLELSRREHAQDLLVVAELSRRGRAVIAVCSGPTWMAAVLHAGARACLDKDVDFPDRLAAAVRAVTGPPTPAPPH
jgi:DNA-binding NarL/FixJ family response regulator